MQRQGGETRRRRPTLTDHAAGNTACDCQCPSSAQSRFAKLDTLDNPSGIAWFTQQPH